MSVIPQAPPQLKSVSHFLKVAIEHETRDPVVAYWARFHGVQKSMEIDKSSPEAKQFLFGMLDWLEKKKREIPVNEAITNETIAQAHIENYAHKLFKWADDNDRKSVFNKNVVKGFYTSSILIDILENFGELGEDFDAMRKYGKWKAAYIHNCLKNGETPTPGPPNNSENDDEDNFGQNFGGEGQQNYGFQINQPEKPVEQNSYEEPIVHAEKLPSEIPSSTNNLSIEQIAKAQKYCKWASSALTFDDVPTAIDNLEKGLRLLKTGVDDG